MLYSISTVAIGWFTWLYRPRCRMNKPLTVTALAKKLDLSITTVSMVLNGRAEQYKIAPSTAARVKRAASGMKYVPNMFARHLRLKKSSVIGVVFPHLRNDWAHHIMSGVYEPLNKAGYIPFIINHQEDRQHEAQQIESLLERRVDAFMINPIAGEYKIYRRIMNLGIPLVFFSDTISELPSVHYSVWDPDETAIAIRHLCEIGAKRIGYLGVNDSRPIARRRYKVFVNTLKKYGVPLNKEWVLMSRPGVPMDKDLRRMFKSGKKHPDALFGVYDDCAMNALDILSSMGVRVPDDVAVAALGDSRQASPLCYDLTTVQAPMKEEGRGAAKLVLDLLQKSGSSPKNILVKGGKLIVRGSTRR